MFTNVLPIFRVKAQLLGNHVAQANAVAGYAFQATLMLKRSTQVRSGAFNDLFSRYVHKYSTFGVTL